MRAKIIRGLDSAIVARLVLFAVIVSLILGGFATVSVNRQAHKQATFTRCLADYNDRQQAVSVARARLNQRQIDNTTAIISSVAIAKSREDVLRAFETYLRDQTKLDQEKRDNPLPPPPSEACK